MWKNLVNNAIVTAITAVAAAPMAATAAAAATGPETPATAAEAATAKVVSAAGIPAFPGAEGWGAATPGGRGPDLSAQRPKVYVVTTLASSGAGSFNEALRATGPRIIVFRVSGVIDVQPAGTRQWYISKDNAYLTIAGQTSPGGVTLVSSTDGSSIIFAYQGAFHDGIFRFLRFRARKHNMDAFTMASSNHFIIDHCDFSGGNDETLDLGSNHHWTLQWCTIANSSEGQTYGFLMGYPPNSHITIHHNLLANHVYRFPEMHWSGGTPGDSGRVDYRNNVCYNGEDYFVYANEHGTPPKSVLINFVGNTFKAGPQSPPNSESQASVFFSMNELGTHLIGYSEDNVMIPKTGAVNRTRLGESLANRAQKAHAMPPVATQSADDAYGLVLDRVGAWPRDPMNTRTVQETRTGTGQFRKDDDSLLRAAPQPPADADLDGMPDFWETAMGLDPASAADNVADKDGDGYLNIEEYVNDLASARLCQPYQNPVYPIPAGWPDYNPACVPTTRIRTGPAPDGRQVKLARASGPGTGRYRIELLGMGSNPGGTVRILDLEGRVLARMDARPVLDWNGKSASGRPLAAGTYWIQWDAGAGSPARASLVIGK